MQGLTEQTRAGAGEPGGRSISARRDAWRTGRGEPRGRGPTRGGGKESRRRPAMYVYGPFDAGRCIAVKHRHDNTLAALDIFDIFLR